MKYSSYRIEPEEFGEFELNNLFYSSGLQGTYFIRPGIKSTYCLMLIFPHYVSLYYPKGDSELHLRHD